MRATEMRGQMPRGGVSGFSPRALRRAMAQRDMQADELAANISVSRQAVSSWLTGATTPSPGSLRRMAEALEVSTETLTPFSAGSPRMADLRARLGHSQAVAAELLGISATTLSGIERGRRAFDDSLAARLAEVYDAGQDEIEESWNRTVADYRAWLDARRKARRQRK